MKEKEMEEYTQALKECDRLKSERRQHSQEILKHEQELRRLDWEYDRAQTALNDATNNLNEAILSESPASTVEDMTARFLQPDEPAGNKAVEASLAEAV